MDYAGFYINLDRSTSRRAETETQLARYGLSGLYQRFPAIEGNARSFPNPVKLGEGELGCFTSHYAVLEQNLGNRQHLHIVEDDVVFSRYMAEVLRAVIAEGNLDHYDILYTDLFIPTSNILYRELKKAYNGNVARDDRGGVTNASFNVMDMKGQKFGGTTSFLVGQKSIGRLRDLYEGELKKGAMLPIDLFICKKAEEGAIKVGCVFPFVTSIKIESGTTIRGAEAELSRLAANLARRSFFIEADLGADLETARKLLPLPSGDPQLQLLTHILGFSISGQYVRF